MPIEFFGRLLEPDELDTIRQQIEGFGFVEVVDPDVRGIVKCNWPHLLPKLPPKTKMNDDYAIIRQSLQRTCQSHFKVGVKGVRAWTVSGSYATPLPRP